MRLGRLVVRVVQDRTSAPHARPVFVIGHQKSGTTAIAALLATAIGERYSHDVSYQRRWRDVADICSGRVPIPELVRRAPSDFACTVIKDPDFTFIAPQLHAYFEKARFVLIVRDPRSNIRSILNRLDIPGNLESLEKKHVEMLESLPGWANVFDPTVFGFPARHYVEVLAHRWCHALDRGASIPDRLLTVKYEDFLQGKSAFIASIAEWLDVPIRASIDGLVDRQYQPAGRTNVNLTTFFGTGNLARITRVCGPRMAHFGYS